MNRICHPDWVKLCVELNYVPNKNTKILSATDYIHFIAIYFIAVYKIDVTLE